MDWVGLEDIFAFLRDGLGGHGHACIRLRYPFYHRSGVIFVLLFCFLFMGWNSKFKQSGSRSASITALNRIRISRIESDILPPSIPLHLIMTS
jgi:hypothetical protein